MLLATFDGDDPAGEVRANIAGPARTRQEEWPEANEIEAITADVELHEVIDRELGSSIGTVRLGRGILDDRTSIDRLGIFGARARHQHPRRSCQRANGLQEMD